MEAISGTELDFPEEAVAFHASLSHSAAEFLEYVREHPACCERSRFQALERRDDFLRYPLQPWPILVSDRVMDRMRQVSIGVCGLLKRIPEVVFGNDPVSLARYYGFEPSYAHLVVEALRDRESVKALLARGDFVWTAAGLKCIEINASAYLGGWESHFWTRMVLEVPEIQSFVAGLGPRVRYGNTVDAFFRHAIERAVACSLCQGEFNMAFAVPEGHRRTVAARAYGREALRQVLSEVTGWETGNLFFCDYRELSERLGCLFLSGKRIHVVVENYSGDLTAEVFRCAVRGGVHLYNGLLSILFADKRNLAILSELAANQPWTDEERAISRAHVPWTREVKAGTTTYEDEEVALPGLLLAARERLILKRAIGAQGTDVFIGKAMSPEEWARKVKQVFDDGEPWVVQEYCESRPYLGQYGDVGFTQHDLVWGLFVFGDVCPGGFLRMMPKSRVGVINAAKGASEGVIVEVQEDQLSTIFPKEVVP